MRSRRILIVLLLCILAAAGVLPASGPPAKAIPQVAGGEEASTRQYPSMAALSTDPGEEPDSGRFCGGTVVDSRHIITAGHCVDDFLPQGGMAEGQPKDQLWAITGRDDLSASGFGAGHDGEPDSVVRVAWIWIHPDWFITRENADLAVLTLAQAVNAAPLPLVSAAEKGLYEGGTAATALGYGYVGLWTQTTRLHRLDVTLNPGGRGCDVPDCVDVSSPTYGKALCGGDSGGPVIIQGWLAGVIATGPKDCDDTPSAGGSRNDWFSGTFTRLTDFAEELRGQLGTGVTEGHCEADGFTGRIQVVHIGAGRVLGVAYQIDKGGDPDAPDDKATVSFADYGTLPAAQFGTGDRNGRQDNGWHALEGGPYGRGNGDVSARFVFDKDNGWEITKTNQCTADIDLSA